MDEPKLRAQQRLDLVDLNRLKTYIKSAFSDMIRDIFGVGEWYTPTIGQRPVILRNFLFAEDVPSNLDITVTRVVTTPGSEHRALIYDKSGELVTGSNSVVAKVHTVTLAPTGTTRYLQVRRVALDDLPETRQFYNSASGKYSQSVDTRTIDDWELQDSLLSAKTNAALADAGWIDIAYFQTSGASLTYLIAYNDILYANLYEWTVGVLNRALPVTLVEFLTYFRAFLEQMRDGREINIGDPTGEAAFDSKGGIRYGKGATLGRGPVYTRYDSDTSVVDCKDTYADKTDLIVHKSKRFVAPNPADYGVGYGYSYGDGSPGYITNLVTNRCFFVGCDKAIVPKNIPYRSYASTTQYPLNNNSGNGIWYYSASGSYPNDVFPSISLRWANTSGGVRNSPSVIFPLSFPDTIRLSSVILLYGRPEALPPVHFINVYGNIIERDYNTGVGTYSDSIIASNSWQPDVGVDEFLVRTLLSGGTYTMTGDKEVFVNVYMDDDAAEVSTAHVLRLRGLYCTVQINEASWRYDT